MKPKILKLSSVVLLFLFIGAGCQKDDLNYDPDSIIGKWEWISTSGGFASTTYPQEDEYVTIEFSEDSIFTRRDNDVITIQSGFYISNDTLNVNNIPYGSFFVKIRHDTLSLDQYNVAVPSLISYFKRIN